MNFKKADKKIISLISAFLGILTAFLFITFHITWAWEAGARDWRTRWFSGNTRISDKVCLILLDQNSLNWGEEVNGWNWPWPREIYGVIIDFCKRSGAKAIGMDILFTEPSFYGEDDDKALANAISKSGNVAGAVFFTDGKIRFTKGAFPIDEIKKAYKILGNVNAFPDEDGIFRKTKPFVFFNDKIIPSLALATFLAGEDKTPKWNFTPKGIFLTDRFIPVDKKNNVILRYINPEKAFKKFSAAEILKKQLTYLETGEKSSLEKELKGKYVFIGFSAPGLHDLSPTPVDEKSPGVIIHATMLDNFLMGNFIKKTSFAVNFTLILFLAGLTAIFITWAQNPFAIFGLATIFMSLPVITALDFYKNGFVIPLAMCQICVISTLFSGLAIKYATEGWQKRFIKNAFKQYLSPVVIEQIIENPEKLKLGGEKKLLTILFSDIEGFTSISEKLEPQALASLLNQYLTAMTDIIIQEGGTVDKYEGDAIIAFWNAPLDVAGHEKKCIKAALRCQQKLNDMENFFKKRLGKKLKMRVGINTGWAVVGNFGSNTKFDYTAIGDAMNLAARLESINKEFYTYTMISESTKKGARHAVKTREIGKITVLGRQKPVIVFEPMSDEEYNRKKHMLNTFSSGLKAYYDGDFKKAEIFFSSIAEKDPPAKAYLKKCGYFLINPPENWRGIWQMTKK